MISPPQQTAWWPQHYRLSSTASARSLGVRNTLRSCNQPSNAIINSRGVSQRLPAGLSILRSEGFPHHGHNALNTRVLEQLVAGIRDPQIRKILSRDRPSTLKKALALAREEKALQAACKQPPRSQPSSPTLPTTPSTKCLGKPAPAAPIPAETSGIGIRRDGQTGPKPAAPSRPLT
ncbi:unnamed protein product [Schistocephalus solidus]|uniref:Transposase n=1 Tax=Schistocephalus solidus TaxID=70667 RepID=A0A183T3J4_SCHSO|nr:unnamed protein product [Schistocephalus solidus]